MVKALSLKLDKDGKACIETSRFILGDKKNALKGVKLIEAITAYDKD